MLLSLSYLVKNLSDYLSNESLASPNLYNYKKGVEISIDLYRQAMCSGGWVLPISSPIYGDVSWQQIYNDEVSATSLVVWSRDWLIDQIEGLEFIASRLRDRIGFVSDGLTAWGDTEPRMKRLLDELEARRTSSYQQQAKVLGAQNISLSNEDKNAMEEYSSALEGVYDMLHAVIQDTPVKFSNR